ncbi:ATP-dependent sacrificial sulfur transferase LarE [bacterium]|nr:ATP-dependent sacrificial sulfur transferase LarE [bacterium]
MLKNKIEKFHKNLQSLGSGLVALSGGVDSSVLLFLATELPSFNLKAATVESPAHPDEEVKTAIELCRRLNVEHVVLRINELENPLIRKNGPDRCYHCKYALYSSLLVLADRSNLNTVLDGSNADDIDDYRPGMRAIRELGIKAPLMDAGFTKNEVREIAKSRNLPMWSEPATACLFTRIPIGEPLELKRLNRISRAEKILRHLGFHHVRVRDHGNLARIEVSSERIAEISRPDIRQQISDYLKKIG